MIDLLEMLHNHRFGLVEPVQVGPHAQLREEPKNPSLSFRQRQTTAGGDALDEMKAIEKVGVKQKQCPSEEIRAFRLLL